MKNRIYIAIDLKSFYASVECVERGLDPMTTNLVVADVSKTEKTICLAVTPSLKAHGISGRARLFEVVQRVKEVNNARRARLRGKAFGGRSSDANALANDPSLELDYIAAPPRMALYRRCSAEIVAIYLKYVSIDDLYAYSIDEVFIDATPYLERSKITAREFARMMIRDVLETTGVTATAGIGENMYLCKVALDITAKHVQPDKYGVRIAELDTMSYRRTLWTHKELTDFWMIGNGIASRLNKLNLYTMGDVARCSLNDEEKLYKEFGKNAQYIIDQAWGWEPVTIADIKAYKPESTSVSAGQVLTRPYSFGETRLIIHEMTESLVLGLVAKGLVTDQIVLLIGYDIDNLKDKSISSSYDGPIETDRYGRKTPKHAHGTANMGKFTSSTRLITEKTLELFDSIADRKLLTRRLNVTANHLLDEKDADTQGAPLQLTVFDDPDEVKEKQLREAAAEEKERRIQRAMIGIKERYGANAILKGMNFSDASTARERNEIIGGHKA